MNILFTNKILQLFSWTLSQGELRWKSVIFSKYLVLLYIRDAQYTCTGVCVYIIFQKVRYHNFVQFGISYAAVPKCTCRFMLRHEQPVSNIKACALNSQISYFWKMYCIYECHYCFNQTTLVVLFVCWLCTTIMGHQFTQNVKKKKKKKVKCWISLFFRVTWYFINHSNMLICCSRNIS